MNESMIHQEEKTTSSANEIHPSESVETSGTANPSASELAPKWSIGDALEDCVSEQGALNSPDQEKRRTGRAAIINEKLRLSDDDRGRVLPEKDTQRINGFIDDFKKTNIGIVVTHNSEDAQKIAYSASYQRGNERYFATHQDIVSVGLTELVTQLVRIKKPICYILEYWSDTSYQSITSVWNPFHKVLSNLQETDHSIILCLSPKIWLAIRNGDFNTGGIAIHAEEEPSLTSEDSMTAGTRYQNIFTPSGKDLQEILLAADRQIIEKTLVRLVLLFPGLSSANYERLLKATLAEKTVLVSPSNGTNDEYRQTAVSLWASARYFFLDAAVLDRKTMAFKTKELEQEASDLAWEDEQGMFDVFTAVSREGPLFGDLRDEADHDLLLAYLNAAAVMADRAPSCFGPKWFEALVTDLHKQVKLKIPDISVEHPEIMILLAELVENKRQNLLTRFAERVAWLADFLIDSGKETLVIELLARLERKGLHEISLNIVLEIRRLSDKERITFLKGFLNHRDQKSRAKALRCFAVEYLEDSTTKVAYLQEVKSWLENAGHACNENLRTAALAFPAIFLESCHSSSLLFTQIPETSNPLFDLLQKEPEVTLLDWMADALKRKDFGSLAERFMPEIDTPNPDIFRLAITLYYLAALPESGRTDAIDLVRQIRGSHIIDTRIQLRSHWQEIADYWLSVEKAGDGGVSTTEVGRVALAKRLRAVCLNLIRN